MKLFRVGVSDRSATVTTRKPLDSRYLTPYLDISSLSGDLHLTVVPGGEGVEIGDFVHTGVPSPLVMSQKAATVLADYLEPNGELTPVLLDGVGPYVVFTPRVVLQIVDLERSIIRHTTYVSFIEKAEFLPVEVPDKTVCLAKGFEMQDVWVTANFVNAVDSAGLTGARFF